MRLKIQTIGKLYKTSFGGDDDGDAKQTQWVSTPVATNMRKLRQYIDEVNEAMGIVVRDRYAQILEGQVVIFKPGKPVLPHSTHR